MAQGDNENSRRLYVNLIIVLVFFVLMASVIYYMLKNEPGRNSIAMERVAERFATSVTNAHWQWRAEGEPNRIILAHHDADGRETDRTPLPMSHLGWPRVEPTSEGCAQLWQRVLNMPLYLGDFQVYAEYFDGVALTDNALDSTCRYRLSVGDKSFEYQVYRGRVQQL